MALSFAAVFDRVPFGLAVPPVAIRLARGPSVCPLSTLVMHLDWHRCRRLLGVALPVFEVFRRVAMREVILAYAPITADRPFRQQDGGDKAAFVARREAAVKGLGDNLSVEVLERAAPYRGYVPIESDVRVVFR